MMTTSISTTILSRTHPDWVKAVHLALGASLGPHEQVAPPVRDLMSKDGRDLIHLAPVAAAYGPEGMVGACLAIVSSGSAALLFPSDPLLAADSRLRMPFALASDGTNAALKLVSCEAMRQGVRLLQGLVTPGADHLAQMFEDSGFRYLTRLLYLEREVTSPLPAIPNASDLTWTSYAQSRKPLFVKALESTYEETRDCPELCGLRRTEEVLETHRACGVFDSDNWWVVSRKDSIAGVLLLAKIPQRSALEVVYIGVSACFRGQNIGNALIHRALETCRERNLDRVILAVDAANTPARKMYARFGFKQTNSRDAWIANSSIIEG